MGLRAPLRQSSPKPLPLVSRAYIARVVAQEQGELLGGQPAAEQVARLRLGAGDELEAQPFVDVAPPVGWVEAARWPFHLHDPEA